MEKDFGFHVIVGNQKMNDYSNDLIYGRNKTERIVSIEPEDDVLEIFIEDKDGKVTSTFAENSYWVLTPKKINNSFVQLKGNLHYKYARIFKNRGEFFKYKSYLKAKNEDFYAVGDAKEAIMLQRGYTYFKGMEVKDVSILSFDLETTGIAHDENSKVLLISTTYRNAKGEIKKKLFAYDEYSSQGEMLNAFCIYVCYLNPSCIIGHNIFGFDLPYLQYVADKENVTLDLGRNGSKLKFDNYESKFRKDGSQFYHYKKVHCYGRELIDTMFLSIKYDATERKFESYGLKSIIGQLKLEKPNRTFYDASKIKSNYTNPKEWVLIKDYCIDDADDALTLFDLMIAPFFYMTQSIAKSFQSVIEGATGSQINSIMCRAYFQQKHSLPKADESSSYEGAISFGIPGRYENVFKVDAKSMYPSIILQYKIYDKDKDPNGYFLEMVETFTNERFKNKDLMEKAKEPSIIEYYDGLQSSGKIFINSAYGTLGASGLLFNSPKNAAKITTIGREIIKRAIHWATGNEYIDPENEEVIHE